MLQSDGRGTLFALVAARRQGGEIYKRWNASYMTFAALFVSEKRDKWKVTLSKKIKVSVP